MMAASMPRSFNSQIPVTPPPDHQMFMKGLFPPNAFQQPSHHNHNHQHHAQQQSQTRHGGVGLGLHEPTPSNSTASYPHIKHEVEPSPTTTTTAKITSPRPPSRSMHPPPQLRTSTHPAAVTSPGFTPTNFKPQPGFSTAAGGIDPNTAAQAAIDPRYIAMASRIASYYQQRCQAVANFQQQRCQQWAAAQRAKCQEMTQAAMLVVAWYIRDRINRRRKRQKKSFKRGLAAKNNALVNNKGKITKGESVRRWVMDVPLKVPEGGGVEEREQPRDEMERDFDMDHLEMKEGEDKDGKLFEVADGLIKSQLARIEVPLLGVLSFDEESESESEEESEMEYEQEEYDEEFEEEEEEYEEEDYQQDEVGGGKGKEEEENTMGSLSKDAQLGTEEGTDRRKGSRDSSVL
ncbi:hypothetical protein B0T21DRAFT_292379 [Apiosordaria backusii]|uniref:Uncharacterized protein n=1 Tax=Apiosordaria backusii TaxID=314023 RepID=A0AA40B7N7_9PEZI|nr:hypothetical protein B0T21DRAFT_292379 [Apiosordaria backusii]